MLIRNMINGDAMFFKTTRERYNDHKLCVSRLESQGFKKTSKPNRWIKSNEWAEIERHVSGNGFVIQYGGVCG